MPFSEILVTTHLQKGVQWLSGRVFDSRLRGLRVKGCSGFIMISISATKQRLQIENKTTQNRLHFNE